VKFAKQGKPFSALGHQRDAKHDGCYRQAPGYDRPSQPCLAATGGSSAGGEEHRVGRQSRRGRLPCGQAPFEFI
jgi:hypothetical protein